MLKDERMTIRIPQELKIKLEKTSKTLNVSTNDVIKFILFDYYNRSIPLSES